MTTISAKDGTQLALYHWPRPSPRAQVLIVHGYGEHATRYEQVAQALVAAGFDTLAIDTRGHGHSGGVRGYVDSFSQYLDDLDVVLAEGEKLAPNVPRLVLGHSFGGLIVTAYAESRKPAWNGLLLSSPFFRVKLVVPAWKVLAAKAASKVYPQLALPSGLSGKEVARDPEIARAYDTDPLNLPNATARWYVESVATQDHVVANAPSITLPVLLMHGEADTVADPARSAELFGRLGSADKTLELVAGAYHEIFNEPPADRERIIARAVEWLSAHA